MREARLDFLAGGGEMGALIRGRDWSRTSLGPAERWPQSLRSAVSILLPSKAQIALFWGPELVTLYNDAYRPVFGAKHPDALGKPIRESWSELWRAGLKEIFENVLATGEAFWARDRPFYMERRGFLEETFFDVSYDPVRDESGRVAGIFCIVSETTGRVLGERRLKLLRELATQTMNAPSVDEVCARTLEVLRSCPGDIPSAELDLDDRNRWKPGVEGRLAVLASGEGRIRLGISPNLLFDEEYHGFFELVAGQVASSVASARAVEAERRRAEALAEIDRAKTAFFSNVSHEFRTPLTLMLGPVEDALADASLPAPQRERLRLVRRSGLRLQKLVNSLLDFARIEAGRAEASYEPVELGAFTAELASTFRSALEKAGLTLSVDCPPLAAPAYVDRDMWEKIVLNLLSNAFKFTFDGGVAVSLREEGGVIRLAVQDSGTGIPPAELPRLFERFRRVEGAKSRTHEGTGIGLALVQELARLHGGAIEVASAEGQGSTFTVSIPAGSAHLPPERIGAPRALASTSLGAAPFLEEAERWLPEPVEEVPARAGARIVWADDNADMRDYVRRLLSPHYDVEVAPDGEAALAAVRRRRPDLVLIDVMMPRLDGFGVLAALRADERTRSLPVILLSARAGEEARLEGLKAGADDYIVKPFTARELLSRISARLELNAMRDRLRRERAELADLFAQTPVPTAVLQGPDLVFELANPAYVEAVGGRDVAGRPLLEALPELRGQGLDGQLREVMRTGQAHVGRERLVRVERNGRLEDSYFTYIYAPLRAEQGRVDRVIAIVNEVTEQVLARKKIEALAAEAQKAASELEDFIENATVAMHWVGPDGTILWANRAELELLGYEREEYVGRNITEFHADRPVIEDILQRLHCDEKILNREVRLRCKDGGIRHALVSSSVHRQDGRFVHTRCFTRDITERKRFEEALFESEARLRAIFHGAPVSIWEEDFTAVLPVVDEAKRAAGGDLRAYLGAHPDIVRRAISLVKIVDVNEAALRVFGAQSREELLQSLDRIFTPETEAVFLEEMVAIGEGRTEFGCDTVCRTLKGETIEVLFNAVFPPPEGGFERVLVTLVDITARRRMEALLLESEERYRAVVESQSEMVCRFRPDGTLVFVNNAYARSMGTTPESLQGASFWDHVPAPDREHVRSMLARMTPDAPEVRIENRFMTAKGERWTLWINRALAFDVQGGVAEAQSTGIDITERKRAEEALREADRKKDEFLAILSHELRNPLAPIRNAVALLRDSGANPEVHAEVRRGVLPMLERQVAHLIRLVDDLLDVSRINRGDITLQKRAVRLEEIVSSAMETSRPLLEARRHQADVHVTQAPVAVMGDPVRLAQVVSNLVNNAAVYTPEGGRIDVSARAEAGQAVIRVRDNGSGIAPEALQGLFELFSRGDSRHDHPGGFGVGLALARRLVEMHGGTIAAASEGPGRGAEFTVRLPIVADVAPLLPVPRAPAPGSGKRVLVVDDNNDAAESLGMVLKLMGAEVRVVHDGAAALAAFEAHKPSVVLLDIGMPGMDGYEVARILRTLDPQRRAALVALTGWGQEEDRRRARDAGFDHHLVKPAEITTLEALLASLEKGPGAFSRHS
ncbi:MAG TPA: ATP-binding protein [Burkholderiales bacterium]|nr:ATP-binding protein [Burkholderiales bacterium]